MTRREFFRTVCLGVLGLCVFTFAFVFSKDKRRLIIQALNTSEGREALGRSMTEPIRRSLQYQSVGRKLLMVDELPQGAYARYEKDIRASLYT